MLGCYGKGKVNKFAEICAGVVLAGEISLTQRDLHGDWVSSHDQFGRNRPEQTARPPASAPCRIWVPRRRRRAEVLEEQFGEAVPGDRRVVCAAGEPGSQATDRGRPPGGVRRSSSWSRAASGTRSRRRGGRRGRSCTQDS